jgi:hypothetical protein
MSKARRNRRRRHEHARNAAPGFTAGSGWTVPPPHAVRGGTAEAVRLAAGFASDTEMPCRATFLNDPVLAGALPPLVIGPGGALIPDSDGAGESPPVLLFEPSRLLAMKDIRTGTVREMRTEAFITGGFHRLSGPAWMLEVADGWSVGRATEMVKLRDPDGDVMAESRLPLDPAWISAAVSWGYVLILHGHPLGVAMPPGKTGATYTVKQRAEEVRQARANGLLVGAIVQWTGTITQTFDWVLFPPGAFGIELPMAYVPRWNFTPHGGPEAFGFVPLNRRGLAPFAEGLVANLTETDLDLVRSTESDPALALVAGYHVHDTPSDKEFFRTWGQAVLAASGLIVMTGDRAMPSVLGADADQDRLACDVMAQSWGAKVLLSDDCVADLAASRGASHIRPPREVIDRAQRQAEYTRILGDKLRRQESFTVDVSDALDELIDKPAIVRWLPNLWPVTCQTCGDPLGAKADVSADGPLQDGKIVLSMHHSSCRPSGVTPLDGVTMSCPTSSFAAGYVGRGSKPRKDDLPVMVVNPSCEQLHLVPDGRGGWRNATLEAFTPLGFARPGKDGPPTIGDAEAEIIDGYLIVTVTGYVVDAPDQEWAVKAPAHVLDQVRRLRGVAVSLVTKALPTLLLPEDLAAALTDDEALVGWVPLATGA